MGSLCAMCVPHLTCVETWICDTGEISLLNSSIRVNYKTLAKICKKIVNLYLLTVNFVEKVFAKL